MRMFAALGFVLAVIFGLGALAPPATAAAWSADLPAPIHDGRVAAGGCCDCGATCQTIVGNGNCPVHCEAAPALALATFVGSAAPGLTLDHARADDRDGLPRSPDPAPPKHPLLSQQAVVA